MGQIRGGRGAGLAWSCGGSRPRRRRLVRRFKVGLAIRPLAVVGLKVEARVVPGGGVTDGVVLWEPILLLPALFLARLYLRNRNVFLPMVRPEKLTLQEVNKYKIRKRLVAKKNSGLGTRGLNSNFKR